MASTERRKPPEHRNPVELRLQARQGSQEAKDELSRRRRNLDGGLVPKWEKKHG